MSRSRLNACSCRWIAAHAPQFWPQRTNVWPKVTSPGTSVGKATKKREPAQGFKEREIVSQPQWQQRTNVWPKVTSPGTWAKLQRSVNPHRVLRREKLSASHNGSNEQMFGRK